MTPEPDPTTIAAEQLRALAPGKEPGPIEGVTDVERQLFGDLADPEARQAAEAKQSAEARATEALATEVRVAVEAGATDASLYEPGRVPMPGDEVIFRRGPATVLKVRDPGSAMGRLDLLRYHLGSPEAFAAVEHDLSAGWHWLGEPPPPEPTAADRVRAAIAAGQSIPKVGSTVLLVRSMPRSFRGTELVGLRSRVVAVADVVGDRITLDLEVEEEAGPLAAPATPGLVTGVVGPVEVEEGWAPTKWYPRALQPPQQDFASRPCDRCLLPIPPGTAVKFVAQDGKRRVNFGVSLSAFAQLCQGCADAYGRLAFQGPPDDPVILPVPGKSRGGRPANRPA